MAVDKFDLKHHNFRLLTWCISSVGFLSFKSLNTVLETAIESEMAQEKPVSMEPLVKDLRDDLVGAWIMDHKMHQLDNRFYQSKLIRV